MSGPKFTEDAVLAQDAMVCVRHSDARSSNNDMTEPMTGTFSYSDAFSRNIGWVADHEQAVLRTKRVAIAGMGGVGPTYSTAVYTMILAMPYHYIPLYQR